MFLVSATLAVEADEKVDSVVRKIVKQLKTKQTIFRDFHLFRAVDVSDNGFYKFNSIEVMNTNINFQDAVIVSGAKGRIIGNYVVIEEAEIQMPNLTVTGSIVFHDDRGFSYSLPFKTKQRSPNHKIEGTCKLMDYKVLQDKDETTIIPGYATYSSEYFTLEVVVNCIGLQTKFRADECNFAKGLVNELGFSNIPKSLDLKIQTALKHM